jgi:hypothetical protein
MKQISHRVIARRMQVNSVRALCRAMAFAGMLALAAVPAGAAGSEKADAVAAAVEKGPAIPPGQESLLLEMLGLGGVLPDCYLVDGQVKYTVASATYACSAGDLEYELAHRSQGAAGATFTDQFALTLRQGLPPAGFGEALASLVRSREAEFEWVWPGDDQQ